MPIKPSKFASQNGQHALEYMILVTLIMAGIIIGGPYVIRSWNAQMKGWEDSVVDSMIDPLTEAPPNIVTIPGCDFVSWGTCGLGNCCGLGYSLFGNSASCTPQQLLQRGVFNPSGCELSDPSMSFDLVARCDTSGTSSTDPAANHCCTPWITPSGCTPGNLGCPVDSDCGINVGCPDGQYRQTHTCDTGYTETGCVADPGCNFTCGNVGQPAPNSGLAYGGFCNGTESTGLTGDTAYTYLNPTAACTATKCEVQCNPTFIATGGSPPCDCPSPETPTGPGGTCIFLAVFQVAPVIDSGRNGDNTTTTINNKSAATSALMCLVSPSLVTSVVVTGVGCGNPGTAGNWCTAEIH